MEGGGGTLSEVHQSAKKLLLRCRDGLERLERLEHSASASAAVAGVDSELSFAVKKDINQIQSLCVEMDRLWRSVAAKPQRDLWKRWANRNRGDSDPRSCRIGCFSEDLDLSFWRNSLLTCFCIYRFFLLLWFYGVCFCDGSYRVPELCFLNGKGYW